MTLMLELSEAAADARELLDCSVFVCVCVCVLEIESQFLAVSIMFIQFVTV